MTPSHLVRGNSKNTWSEEGKQEYKMESIVKKDLKGMVKTENIFMKKKKKRKKKKEVGKGKRKDSLNIERAGIKKGKEK